MWCEYWVMVTQKWYLWTAVRCYMCDACTLGSHGTISTISPQANLPFATRPCFSHAAGLIFPLTLCVVTRVWLSCKGSEERHGVGVGGGLEVIRSDAGWDGGTMTRSGRWSHAPIQGSLLQVHGFLRFLCRSILSFGRLLVLCVMFACFFKPWKCSSRSLHDWLVVNLGTVGLWVIFSMLNAKERGLFVYFVYSYVLLV